MSAAALCKSQRHAKPHSGEHLHRVFRCVQVQSGMSMTGATKEPTWWTEARDVPVQ
jgi:hypothetical protein